MLNRLFPIFVFLLCAATLRAEKFTFNEFHINLAAGETYSFEKQEPLIESSFEFGLRPENGTEKQIWNIVLSCGEKKIEIEITSALNLSSLPPAFEYKRTVTMKITADGASETFKFTGNVAEESSPFFVKFSFDGKRMLAEGGSKTLKSLGHVDCRFIPDKSTLASVKKSEIYRFSFLGSCTLKEAESQRLSKEQLAERLDNTAAPEEGLWKFLDEEIDTDFARRGGNYLTALLDNHRGQRILYYISGDKTGAEFWQTGMVKAILTPSELAGSYDVVWLDAFGETLAEGVNAFFEGNTLTIVFPYEKAKLRFVKSLNYEP